jgi:hypothetical protein
VQGFGMFIDGIDVENPYEIKSEFFLENLQRSGERVDFIH